MVQIAAYFLDKNAEKQLEGVPAKSKALLDEAGTFVTQLVVTFPGKVVTANETGTDGSSSDL
jgi:hypothetical protein